MAKTKEFKIFTRRYSQIIKAETVGIAVNKFAKYNDDYVDIVAVIDTERGIDVLNSESNSNKHIVTRSFSYGELKTAFEQARCNDHSFDDWYSFNYG